MCFVVIFEHNSTGIDENMWDCQIEVVRLDDILRVCHTLSFVLTPLVPC